MGTNATFYHLFYALITVYQYTYEIRARYPGTGTQVRVPGMTGQFHYE